jgi:hypothetical protein
VQHTNKHLAPGDVHEELTWSLAMHHVARDWARGFRKEVDKLVAERKIGGDDVLCKCFLRLVTCYSANLIWHFSSL